MQPSSQADYQQLLTEVIKKQIVILGPDITLSKARNVKGLTVADDGTVTNVSGPAQEVIQALIDQFVQLSGLIVKKTMEPLLSLSQPLPQMPQPQGTVSPVAPQPLTQAPLPPTTQPVPPAPSTAPVSQSTIPVGQDASAISQAPTSHPPAAPTISEPAKNPLAA